MDDIVERLRRRAESWERDGELAPDCVDAQWDREGADEIERLRQEVDLKGSRLHDALDEIDRLRREVLELRGVVRAHEGMYTRAAVEIDRLRSELYPERAMADLFEFIADESAEEILRLRAEVDLKGYRVERLLNALEGLDQLILRSASVDELRHRIRQALRGVAMERMISASEDAGMYDDQPPS